MNELINVVTDGIWRQGRCNLSVRLMTTDGQLLPAWQAGAHIDVHLQPGMIRQYSLTGAENRRDCYEICVALEAESRGGSRYIHETLRPGMQLAISPPRNLFPLVAARKVILLAAGIGITPLSVMAQALEAAGQAFELHYYLRERGDEAFAALLNQNFAAFVTSGTAVRVSAPALISLRVSLAISPAHKSISVVRCLLCPICSFRLKPAAGLLRRFIQRHLKQLHRSR